MSKVYKQINSIAGTTGAVFGGGGGGGGGGGTSYPRNHPVSRARQFDNNRDPETVAATREAAKDALCSGAAGVAGGATGAFVGAATKSSGMAWGSGATAGSIVMSACKGIIS